MRLILSHEPEEVPPVAAIIPAGREAFFYLGE